jgi:hypothetical protein
VLNFTKNYFKTIKFKVLAVDQGVHHLEEAVQEVAAVQVDGLAVQGHLLHIQGHRHHLHIHIVPRLHRIHIPDHHHHIVILHILLLIHHHRLHRLMDGIQEVAVLVHQLQDLQVQIMDGMLEVTQEVQIQPQNPRQITVGI